jgi:hypothetical protein
MQALYNKFKAFELISILVDQWKTLSITKRSMMTIVEYKWNESSIFEFLLQYCKFAEKMLTKNLLQTTIETITSSL